MVRSELPANLRDIRRLNRYTGGTRLAVRTLLPLLPDRQSSILDVATGSADIPRALRRAAVTKGRRVEVTAVDLSPEVLMEAGADRDGTVKLMQADARQLPFADEQFDVVSLFLALHHFDPTEAAQVLREMWRVASVGIVVTDLSRSVPAYLGVWLLTRTMARNRLTKHDGPLSVLRAYTVAEVRELARQAGLPVALVRRHGPARLSLVALKGSHGR